MAKTGTPWLGGAGFLISGDTWNVMGKMQPRGYLTFTELMTRWQMSENELRYAIISGSVKPSILLSGSYHSFIWEESIDGSFVARPICDQDGNERSFTPKGWHYLQQPKQTKAFDCEFCWVSDDRTLELDFQLGNWYFLYDELRTLTDVKESAVFLNKEIKKYETDNPLIDRTVESPMSDKPLGTTERNTLLKLVIGMAIKGYRYDPTALKNNAPKEIVDDLADLGIAIDNGTVLKYLKAAVNAVLPAKPGQP